MKHAMVSVVSDWKEGNRISLLAHIISGPEKEIMKAVWECGILRMN